MRQLLQLDQLWTREAALNAEPSPGREERVGQLRVVVDEMGRLLEEGQRLGPSLAFIFDTHAQQVRARFEALIDPSSLTDEGRSAALLTAKDQEALRTFVERRANGDVVALLKDAVDTLQRRADDERRQLDTEFERISQGNTSDGDLSEDTHHSALIIEAGLVLAGAPEAAVIVEAAVLVAVSARPGRAGLPALRVSCYTTHRDSSSRVGTRSPGDMPVGWPTPSNRDDGEQLDVPTGDSPADVDHGPAGAGCPVAQAGQRRACGRAVRRARQLAHQLVVQLPEICEVRWRQLQAVRRW
jgi:hypothetical protein